MENAMDDEAPGAGHNTGGIAADRLQSIVQRHENIEAEIRERRDDQKDIMTEAKSAGLDPKILRQVIRLHRMDKDARDEADHLLALYRRAIGID